MADRKSIASLLLFAGSSLCFFFPFVTVSCGGVTSITLTGQQLATGTTLTNPQDYGPARSHTVSADPFAEVAGICALIGVALSLASKRMSGNSMLGGAIGAASLLLMKSRFDEQIQKQGIEMLQIHYEIGYILTVLLLVGAATWNGYLYFEEKEDETDIETIPSSLRSSIRRTGWRFGGNTSELNTKSVPSHFCSHCGQPIDQFGRFCTACGKPSAITSNSPTN